jgi:hypothetical protein
MGEWVTDGELDMRRGAAAIGAGMPSFQTKQQLQAAPEMRCTTSAEASAATVLASGSKWRKFSGHSTTRRTTTTLRVHLALQNEARKAVYKRRRVEDIEDAKTVDADGFIEFNEKAFHDFYTEEAIQRRLALRYEPRVLAQLRAFARAMDLHAMHTSQPRTVINQAFYTFLFIKISLAMTTSPTREELLDTVAEDWAHDCRDESQLMSYEQLKDAIFEVADIFTNTDDAQDYADFL